MTKNKFNLELSSKLEQIGINIQDKQLEMFYKYMEMLKTWNEKMNLTAITEDSEIIQKHFVDSLTIENLVKENDKIIDIGTGAGFPGIPIKIYKEGTSITLLDSLNKRLVFLDEVIKELKLQQISTIHGRAEDLGVDKKYREAYDIAVSRAVASLNTLIEYMLPFVKVNGICICMKGPNAEDELNDSKKALQILGGKIQEIQRIYLPGTDIERNIIIIKKVKNTPRQYPRKAGKPTKEPII